MEPALDVIGRTLHGESSARAFLERTSLIYVLDVTNPASPKTYGCWNFIHQALNEVERYESSSAGRPAAGHDGTSLVAHVRLLAAMALKVARRSPQGDRAIVATCISNAADYHCSASQSQWLFDLNLELREIVMGRIAAIAFDFSFHRSGSSNSSSAFADHVVMDTFNAILAANAVATGPSAVRHFATEWIIPSSKNIPVLALVSVAHHLALEGMRLASPAGTMDMLQQLSVPITSMVLVPAMSEAVTDNNEEEEETENEALSSVHINNSRILAKALKALDVWCEATTLTLPQLRHISSKINLDFVDILNDAMYSDSPEVVSALADFIDRAMDSPLQKELSEDRMNQVRHIIQVNESAFRANFSPDHLQIIENKELASILGELASSVGLQRVRFLERQNQGDLEVCHNLARLGRSIAAAWLDVHRGEQIEPERGLVEFLIRAASHQSVNISGMALGTTSQFISQNNSLARELLPLLQRKAIIPHQASELGHLSLIGMDQFSLSIEEFMRFREHVVADALVACWRFDGTAYMDSCTSAIEEFCAEHAEANLSFHLEAALFCIESLGSLLVGEELKSYPDQVARCITALSRKAKSITANPVTIARLCLFLQNWCSWFHANQKTDAGGDLAVAALSYSLGLVDQGYAQTLAREADVSPILQACLALERFISSAPTHFATESSLKTLTAVWQSLCSERRRGLQISPSAMKPLGRGVCTAILHARENLRFAAFESVASPLIESVDQQVKSRTTLSADRTRLEKLLEDISGDISLLAASTRAFSRHREAAADESRMEEDHENGETADVPTYVISVVWRSWPNIAIVATDYCDNENLCSAVCELLYDLIPSHIGANEHNAVRLRDLSTLVSTMLQCRTTPPHLVGCVCRFLHQWVLIHGREVFEQVAAASSDVMPLYSEMAGVFQGLLVQMLSKAQACLGSSWMEDDSSSNDQQRQGQQAFESRPTPKPEQTFCQCLDPILSLVQRMTSACPRFLLQVRTQNDAEGSFLRTVTGSAASALSAHENSLVLRAIQFFEALSEQAGGMPPLKDILANARAGVVDCLLKGCCGKFESGALAPASSLLHRIARDFTPQEIESDMSTSFQQGFFQLGDQAKRLLTTCVAQRCGMSGAWSAADLERLLERIWHLHRTDDSGSLPSSDSVARLLRKYATS